MVDEENLKRLIRRELPWEEILRIMSQPKEADRFEKYLSSLQEMLGWKDKIVLPYSEHLMIVKKDDGRYVLKALCGHEFGDYRENWKLKALMRVRRTKEDFREIYPAPAEVDPDWAEIREFICPGCGTLLDVDVVPPGYPILNEFQPDVETLYTKWLKKPPP